MISVNNTSQEAICLRACILGSIMKATFLEIYSVLVFRATSIVKNEDDAYDIVQDLFLAIDNQKDKLNNISNKRGYLYGMVTKKSLMFLRERQRHSEIEKAIAPGVTHEGSNLLFDIDSLLSDLTDLQRQIVMLHDIEGFSCFEIAIKIARTPIAVKKQLALAHQKLKRTYKNEC